MQHALRPPWCAAGSMMAPSVREVLQACALLFGARCVEQDLPWFMAQQLLPAKVCEEGAPSSASSGAALPWLMAQRTLPWLMAEQMLPWLMAQRMLPS